MWYFFFTFGHLKNIFRILKPVNPLNLNMTIKNVINNLKIINLKKNCGKNFKKRKILYLKSTSLFIRVFK